MKQFAAIFRYIIFWALFGVVIAGVILFTNGDLRLNGHDDTRDSQAVVNSFADAVALASPAVVSIHALTFVETRVPEGVKLLERFLGGNSPHRPKTETRSTSGSGVILDAEGYILTNLHVIKGADKLGVSLIDGRSATAEVVGADPETDLAVLKIDLDKLPTARLADISKVRIGDVTLAIGFPFDIGQTVTQGIISATGRNTIGSTTYQNFLQTDAAINPGNSGGALINSNGEVIGINSLIYSSNGNFQGISFAIPIDMASYVLQQIKQNGFVSRGWLGAEGQNVPRALLEKIGLKDINGVLITGVEPDGPAAAANIQEGDIITHINGEPIGNINDVIRTVADSAPGKQLLIGGLRKRKSFSTAVTLGQRPLRSQ